MLRVTFLRAVLFLPSLAIILFIFWFTLPFPQQSPGSESAYVNRVLHAGKRLVTVHQHAHTYHNGGVLAPEDYRPEHEGTWRALILEWQLRTNPTSDKIYLQIGRPQDTIYPDFGGTLDLTKLAGVPTFTPGFGHESIIMWAGAGDQDGVCAPNFYYADATLLYQQASQTWQNICLRVLVPEIGIVQIWKNMPGWDNHVLSDLAEIDDNDREAGLIATFNLTSIAVDHQQPRLEHVNASFQDALLPSKTWPIRRLILFILQLLWEKLGLIEPVVVMCFQLFQIAIMLGLLYAVCVLLIWFVWGRPQRFSRWAKNFWMTRYVSRRLLGVPEPGVWSLTGPVDEVSVEEYSRRGRPKPLANPAEFFTSKSPLDDLLATFEVTRWMLRPIASGSSEDHDGGTDRGPDNKQTARYRVKS